MCHRSKGALLIEALVALSLLSALLLIGTQAILAGLSGAKSSGEKDTAALILRESVDAIRASTESNWVGIYGSLRSPAKYHPVRAGDEWIISTGDEVLTVNQIPYTRHFVIEDVSRDGVTRSIDPVFNPVNIDPSTLKITITVAWRDANSLTQVEYLARWRNKICAQSEWNTPGSVGAKNCPDTSYDATTDITAGASLTITPFPPPP